MQTVGDRVSGKCLFKLHYSDWYNETRVSTVYVLPHAKLEINLTSGALHTNLYGRPSPRCALPCNYGKNSSLPRYDAMSTGNNQSEENAFFHLQ